MNRNERHARAHQWAKSEGRPLARLTSSTNPDRIKTIQSHMLTPNFTREGVGHIVRRERQNVGTAIDPIPYDVYRLSARTTIHSVPPSGFYRGRYR